MTEPRRTAPDIDIKSIERQIMNHCSRHSYGMIDQTRNRQIVTILVMGTNRPEKDMGRLGQAYIRRHGGLAKHKYNGAVVGRVRTKSIKADRSGRSTVDKVKNGDERSMIETIVN